MSSLKIGVLNLAYCGGCEVAFLSVEDVVKSLANGDTELRYCTIAVGERNIPEVDAMLVTGTVRSTDDKELLKEAREKSRFIVAYGTCACYGGIPGLLNLDNLKEALKSVFGERIPSVNKGAPTSLLDEARPIDAVVKVDYMVPGCPPPGELTSSLIKALIKEEPLVLPATNVCSKCPRNTGERVIRVEARRRIKSLSELDPNKCFLEQGILCLGPITLGACKATCPAKGIWCSGCMGPLPGRRFDEELIDLVSSVFSNMPPDKLRERIPDILKITYMFVAPRSL